MNKKQLMLLGAAAVAGYFTLTAFGGKTKAEQMAEITEKAKMQLEEIRTAEKAKCDEKVAAAVNEQYAAMAAAEPEPAPATTKGGKKPAKKGGPKVDPLPQPSAPSNPKQDKMNSQPNTEAKQDKMAPPAPNTDKKKAKMGGGGK